MPAMRMTTEGSRGMTSPPFEHPRTWTSTETKKRPMIEVFVFSRGTWLVEVVGGTLNWVMWGRRTCQCVVQASVDRSRDRLRRL